MRKIALLLVVILCCAGCGLFMKPPEVTVRDLRVVSLDGAGAGMELSLAVKNPNSYDIKLLGYTFDLKVMTLPLAQGSVREEVTFTAGGETELRIPVRVSYGSLLDILRRMPDPERIPYTLTAGLDLKTPIGQKSVPVNRTGTYAIPKKYRPGAIMDRLGDFLRQNQ